MRRPTRRERVAACDHTEQLDELFHEQTLEDSDALARSSMEFVRELDGRFCDHLHDCRCPVAELRRLDRAKAIVARWGDTTPEELVLTFELHWLAELDLPPHLSSFGTTLGDAAGQIWVSCPACYHRHNANASLAWDRREDHPVPASRGWYGKRCPEVTCGAPFSVRVWDGTNGRFYWETYAPWGASQSY